MKTKYTDEEINRMYPEKRFTTPQIVGALAVVGMLTFGILTGINRSSKKEVPYTIEVHFNNGDIDTMSFVSKEEPYLSYGRKTKKSMIVFDDTILCYNVNYFREL